MPKAWQIYRPFIQLDADDEGDKTAKKDDDEGDDAKEEDA